MTTEVAKELVIMMCSWAATLAGQNGLPQYAPDKVKNFEPPAAYFVSHAEILADPICNNDPNCKVEALQRDGKIFFDSRLDFLNNTKHLSIGVHECVHYYQFKVMNETEAGAYGRSLVCGREIQMEREAYGIQQQFLVQYGVYMPSPPPVEGASICTEPDRQNDHQAHE